MKSQKVCCSVAVLASLLFAQALRADVNLYSTLFESTNGYTAGSALVGQQGWLGAGSGGNGIEPLAPGLGQSAYVGNAPPVAGGGYLITWKPINYDPVGAGTPIVKFSVTMGIEDSTNGEYDNFRWICYNSLGQDLFEIDFDNGFAPGIVGYFLDSGGYTDSGVRFNNGALYTLSVTMDFGANLWGASLDNNLIATNQPITTTSAALEFGDADALWLVYNSAAPGNNYMLFDNFSLTASAGAQPAQPTLALLNKTATQADLRLSGEDGRKFAIDASTNLTQWTALTTNTISGGYFDVTDSSVGSFSRRFYRARFVP